MLLLLISSSLLAQEFTIINKATQEIVSNVTASNGKTKYSVSDIDGKIDLTKFDASEIIYIKHVSFEGLEIYKSKILTKTIQLTPKSNALEEVFLSASKKEVKRSRIAQEIHTLTQKDIVKAAPQTTADMLSGIPGIKVQKSQFGGGSPVIRGMEANRVLLVVDGVRMNNAIYRKGHLQNSISVSPNMLERTEVIYGPSSVMYGSDALGGVIHYYTKKPKTNDKLKFIPGFLTRYSTVNEEFTANVSVEIQSKRVASFTSISHSKFGDLKMGKNRSHGYENWGLQAYYSDNSEVFYNPIPVKNPDPETQKNVGFNQLDILQKIIFPLSKTTDLSFNIQYSKSSDIDRFDKLTQYSGGELKFAEWHYGPQKRFLASSQIEIDPKRQLLDNGKITIAYQNINESRIQRKFNSLKRSYRYENVKVFSVNGDFEVPIKTITKRVFSYGTEFTYNKVTSTSSGKILDVVTPHNIGLGNDFVVQTRYPDGGSSYMSSAFYVDYRQDISSRETLNTGIRVTNTILQAKWDDFTYVKLKYNNITLNNTAVTATVGYVFKPIKSIQFNAVVSSGFRSPNIDDIGKIREKSGFVTVPNVNLKPEHVFNGEITLIKYINNKKANFSFTTYYSLLNNYITRDLFALNGSATIEYDNEIVTTIANVNKDQAYIFGGTVSFNGKIAKNYYAKASVTYTEGKAKDSGDPLSSIPPTFGMLEFGYSKKKWDTSINLRYNAKKKFKDYNLAEGIDNEEQTPFNPITGSYDLGNPAWKTVNIKTMYQLNNSISLLLNIDNITDQHYKEFASSISAGGRNFSFSIIGNF